MEKTIQKQEVPTLIGAPLGGGFYFGDIKIEGRSYSQIIAPKSGGQLAVDSRWNSKSINIPSAMSFCDGLANTLAMAAAGSEIARWALNLRIGGFDDWHIGALDQVEMQYRYLKPTKESNWCYLRSGINLSALVPTQPYTPEHPIQTAVAAFQADADEAFDPAWYWTSTQHASGSSYAWVQYFNDGFQNTDHKDDQCRVRAVRRLLIIE